MSDKTTSLIGAATNLLAAYPGDRSLRMLALEEAINHPRQKVYAAIDSERDYQDALPTSRTDGKQKTVGDYICMMGVYYDKALQAWACNPGNDAALDVMRKLGAIAVRCMEEHWAPLRKIEHHKPKDPVYFEPDGSYWFLDETGTDRFGPYETYEEAKKELGEYVEHLNDKSRTPRYEDQPGSGNVHASDCATHNGPAIAPGDCDCEAGQPVNVTMNVRFPDVEEFKKRQDQIRGQAMGKANDPIDVAHRSAMDAYGLKGGDELSWLDIRHEAYREYVYPDGVRYRVDQPLQLNVKTNPIGDSHRIRTRSGRGIYVPAGWLAIEWTGYDGQDATTF